MESHPFISVLTMVLITYEDKTSPSSNTTANWEKVFHLRLLPSFDFVSQKTKDGNLILVIIRFSIEFSQTR